MSDDAQALSDRAIGVFAFAAYHQLSTGQKVAGVTLSDGKGHGLDPDAVDELARRGLVTVNAREVVLGDKANAILAEVIDRIRGAASAA